jgi:exonuclease SbcC
LTKISKLQIKGFLGIKELKFEPKHINIIKGANEAGKTSLLEAIEKVIFNKGRRVKYVKTGENEANLYVELDNGLAVERTLREEGSDKVTVTKDGYNAPKPETTLKSLIGTEGFQFNPVDFLQKKDSEQVEILLSLVPMRVNEDQIKGWFGEVAPVNLHLHALQVLKELEKYYYNKRHVANGEVKALKNQIDALFEQLPPGYVAEDWEKVNIGELWKEVAEARDFNARLEKAQEYLEQEEEKKQAVLDKLEALKATTLTEAQRRKDRIQSKAQERKSQILKQIEELQAELVQLQNKTESDIKDIDKECEVEIARFQEQATAALDKIKEQADICRKLIKQKPIDVAPLEEQAQDAEQMKGYIPIYKDMLRVEREYKEALARAEWLNQAVQKARELPAQLLADIQLPVKGLGIDAEGNVTIDKLPIRNLSDSRKIRLALDIARATCGPLKVICLDRFESLDPVRQQMVYDEIKDDEYQYFITDISRDYDEEGNYVGELRVETL